MSKKRPEFTSQQVRKMTGAVNLQTFVEASKKIDPEKLAIELEREIREAEEQHVISKRALERVINI